MLIVGAIAFVAAEFFYGSRGPDSGAVQFILYGMVGFVPGAICSWLAHEAIDLPDAPGPAVTDEPETKT